ncbi:hypothetical protein SYK_28220 [Pseudodesulfovibrio nedwellii]|uniref:GtrA/DPMS transmembrane domain-containing protein n=2 Tax=Pseudodesulfovibrio nedwellii TaxID=2973072 RepID=A0ABM8B3Y5_9BACT|nr:hypothetical protein SYK_28220 [Pseudodesulfovibrio nedwellii]
MLNLKNMSADKICSIQGLPLFLKDGIRFLLAGGLNTILTLAIYQLFLFFISAQPAYALSWCIGFIFLLCVYPAKVFPGATTNKKQYFLVALVYMSVFFLGLFLIKLTVQTGINSHIAIFLVMSVTTVTNFLLMRSVLRK